VRSSFFDSCPICAEARHLPVVEFPELVYVRCAGCRFIYKREQVTGLGVGYNETYFKFNRAKYLHRWAHRVRKCRRQLLACLEYAPHATRMLDVGCSAGYVLEAARSLGLSEMGLDYAEFAVNLCRERGYQAEQGSLTQMPFPDESFDIVTLKHTLEHVEDPMRALREIHRVLKPGGVALVVVPDADYFKLTLIPRYGRSFRPEKRGWQHHVYFYAHNLKDAAQRTGLTTVLDNKAVLRRRLARGPRALYEWARFGYLIAWTAVCRILRLRRELFHVVRREPAAVVGQQAPVRLAAGT